MLPCPNNFYAQVEHYPLSVQSGNGHDLNISLFERLVVQGFPFATLSVQHRMHPGISNLIKHMYPGAQIWLHNKTAPCLVLLSLSFFRPIYKLEL